MFPARNRLMAALGGITVVVEAAERSGSLITAEMALDCGRQVGAVPGPVTSWRSSGTNRLLADGAAVIREAQDVLDLLLGPGAEVVGERGRRLRDEERAIVLDAVEAGAATADAVAAGRGLPLRGGARGARRARARRLSRRRRDRADCSRTGLAAPPPEPAAGSLYDRRVSGEVTRSC